MKNFKGTQEDWKFNSKELIITSKSGKDLFVVAGLGTTHEEDEYNSILASKSPQMLTMLEELVSEFSIYKTNAQGTSKCDAILRAEKLIKDATKS